MINMIASGAERWAEWVVGKEPGIPQWRMSFEVKKNSKISSA
jgi:hypothetical protein